LLVVAAVGEHQLLQVIPAAAVAAAEVMLPTPFIWTLTPQLLSVAVVRVTVVERHLASTTLSVPAVGAAVTTPNTPTKVALAAAAPATLGAKNEAVSRPAEPVTLAALATTPATAQAAEAAALARQALTLGPILAGTAALVGTLRPSEAKRQPPPITLAVEAAPVPHPLALVVSVAEAQAHQLQPPQALPTPAAEEAVLVELPVQAAPALF
jgi:hypothetical protein